MWTSRLPTLQVSSTQPAVSCLMRCPLHYLHCFCSDYLDWLARSHQEHCRCVWVSNSPLMKPANYATLGLHT